MKVKLNNWIYVIGLIAVLILLGESSPKIAGLLLLALVLGILLKNV